MNHAQASTATQRARGRGYVPVRGDLPSPEVNPQNSATRTPLTSLFPECRSIQGGFREIAVPAGFTSPAGRSAWYPLIDVLPSKLYGGDGVALFGYDVELASTDNGDNTAVDAGHVDWGSKTGEGAMIVIGTDLPISDGAWTDAPCPIPGAQEGDGVGTLVALNQTGYYACVSFPIGAQNDALPFKARIGKSFAPYAFRVPLNQRLQVALVVDGQQIETGASNTLYGYGKVTLNVGLTRAIDTWR